MSCDEPEYYFTIDLGRTYGPKLVEAALDAGAEDIERFAALVLCTTLDRLEVERKERSDRLLEEFEKIEIPDWNLGSDLDDGIPF